VDAHEKIDSPDLIVQMPFGHQSYGHPRPGAADNSGTGEVEHPGADEEHDWEE
jgi:hypothetical protein